MSEFEKFIHNEYLKYEKITHVDRNDDEFNQHFKKYNFFDFEDTLKVSLKDTGQIFLFEVLDGYSNTICYPKIGLFLNYLPCDQTLELEWMNFRRTWESNRKYTYNFNEPYHNTDKDYNFYNLPSKYLIDSEPQWTNYHLIYGVWDRLPDWKTLRRHYEKTWWFHRNIDEQRDLNINRLLNE